MARVVFLGTPEAAVPTLETLAVHHEVGLVVTQPDRPQGRSRHPVPPPVKQSAEALGFSVAQPERRSEMETAIRDSGPFDLGVVVAYGRILRPEVLGLIVHGFLNAHFSLLPRWRGAAPVARALMAGDEMTGVTIIRLDEGLDTGPVLTAQAVDIEDGENAGELTRRLARLAANLLLRCIDPYLNGSLQPVDQSDEGLTYADKINAEDRPLDPSHLRQDFLARIRGLAPDPGAILEIDGEPFRILSARPVDFSPGPGRWRIYEDTPVVGVKNGGVALIELQPPGKRVMTGAEWSRGRRRDTGRAG